MKETFITKKGYLIITLLFIVVPCITLLNLHCETKKTESVTEEMPSIFDEEIKYHHSLSFVTKSKERIVVEINGKLIALSEDVFIECGDKMSGDVTTEITKHIAADCAKKIKFLDKKEDEHLIVFLIYQSLKNFDSRIKIKNVSFNVNE